MSASESKPLVWMLVADKQGDNRQAQVVADLLDVPYEVRHVYPLPKYVKGKPWVRASINHLDLERSDPLTAPWPDILITVGRRPSMAALWIQKQSQGRTRIVLVGRQPRHLNRYAMVISSCQYITARDPRIVRIALPLDDSDTTDYTNIATDGSTALLVGGPTRTYRMLPGDARAMLEVARRHSGDALIRIVTSRRTPAAVVREFEGLTNSNTLLLAWSATPAPGQPTYSEVIRSSERFVVTGDSISMVCDAVRTARPVGIFVLPYKYRLAGLWHRLITQVATADNVPLTNPIARCLRWIADSRLMRLPRSFSAFFEFLIAHGSASYIDDGFPSQIKPIGAQDTEELRRRLAQLVDSIPR